MTKEVFAAFIGGLAGIALGLSIIAAVHAYRVNQCIVTSVMTLC